MFTIILIIHVNNFLHDHVRPCYCYLGRPCKIIQDIAQRYHFIFQEQIRSHIVNCCRVILGKITHGTQTRSCCIKCELAKIFNKDSTMLIVPNSRKIWSVPIKDHTRFLLIKILLNTWQDHAVNFHKGCLLLINWSFFTTIAT